MLGKNHLILTILISVVAAVGCGNVTDSSEKDKTAEGAAASPDSAAAQAAAAAPVYVSHTVVNNNTIHVTLSLECTDATVTNTANYILNGGLQIQSAVKDATDKTKLILTTTTQQAQSYTLTILNLTSTAGTPITGVIQVVFTGLALPTATFTWRNPVDQSAFPETIGTWTLCDPNVSTTACTVQPYYNKSAIDILVAGTNVAAYKYKIDAGAWGAEIPVATPLTLSGLSEGYHTLYVVVKHTLGYWQETTSPDVKTFSWVQDTLPAADAAFDTVTLPTTSGGTTASQSVNIRVIGSEIARYKICLDNGAYNDCTTSTFKGTTPTSVNNNISIPNTDYTAILTPGAVTFKVIGYDASGNAQTTPVAAGTFSYTIDTQNVEAVYKVSDLPGSINNGTTSATINVLSTYGAVTYIGEIIDGTDCSTVAWATLAATPVPVATPITRSGMTDAVAQKTICAVGRSVGGLWQGSWSGVGTPPNITKYTWLIDTSAPVATVYWKSPIAAPTSTTQTTGYQFQVSSSGGASHYRYAVVTGAGAACSTGTFSSNITIETDIAVDPPTIATSGTTVYKVCVIAGDLAGNWQTTASASSSGEWTVDLDPPASNPSFTAASAAARSFNTAALTFSIDNNTATSDTYYYQVQVATDTGFTNIISDTTVKSCKAISLPDCPAALTTKDFQVAVDSFQSASYYARVKAGDVLGNMQASYGATSAEHYVVGKISGVIKNQANTAVSGISIKILTTAGTDVTSLYGGTITTDATGTFTIDNVRTAKLGYQIRAAQGDATYYPATKRNVTVQEKGTAGTLLTNIGILNIAAIAGATSQTVSAKVVDADDGWMLGYAEVKLIDYLGNTVATARSLETAANCTSIPPVGSPPTNIPKAKFDLSSTCGDVSFTSVTPGTYTIQVNGDSWGTTNQRYNRLDVESVVVHSSTAAKGRIPLVRLLTGQDIKIVLSWGAQEPRDPDMHMVGTLPSGQTLTNVNGDTCNTNQFHIWAGRPNVGFSWQQQYSSKTRTYPQGNAGYSSQNFFPLDPSTTAALVQDANSGYGPEAINLISGYTDGTYWVTVINWGGWYPGAYGVTKASQQWDVTQVGIKVYDANGLTFEMIAAAPSTAPSQLAPATAVAGCQSTTDWQQCELWQAFKITVAGGGSAGRQFTPVNTYQNWKDSSNASVYDLSKCYLNTF
jgi:hypothetical protein